MVRFDPSQHNVTFPYGPTSGMLQALQLMRKSTPAKIDGNFLRMNKIAPGNEYKVVGALRFLGIINEEGRPTEKSRLLKTKGATFTSNLQTLVREAYASLFDHLEGNDCSQEDIYNYFVAKEGMGTEMATKTTRFFIHLCRLAEIDLGFNGKRTSSESGRTCGNGNHHGGAQNGTGILGQVGSINGFPLILALTPEMASMDTDELAEFLKKLKEAIVKANADGSNNPSS